LAHERSTEVLLFEINIRQTLGADAEIIFPVKLPSAGPKIKVPEVPELLVPSYTDKPSTTGEKFGLYDPPIISDLTVASGVGHTSNATTFFSEKP
jgi:hypothetical protein